ncbi:MAG TPA: HupE/UreJ family protein [Candidatus Eisenbacteria bacterium]|nr:HupE/UreJ family protein [Candidatus Eisenbacteria bacterium]
MSRGEPARPRAPHAPRGAALLAAALLLSPAACAAHSQPYSWVDVTVTGDSLRGTVTGHVVDVAHEIGEPLPAALLAPGGLPPRAARVRAAFARLLVLTADGGRLAPRWGAVTAVPGKHAVRAAFAVAWRGAAELGVEGPLFTWESTHETYVNVTAGGRLVLEDVLDPGRRRTGWRTGARPQFARVALRFGREGVRHIFMGPDHILFIVGLLLLGGGLRRLLKIVTAFTAAHSVTLALATLGLVQPPARVIEPAIALSIVAIGIENLLAAGRRDRRAWLAFGFGFVHGFGFASVLRELALPPGALGAALASFNLGVELGQMAIVLAVAPALALLRARRPALAAPVVAWGSAGVIAAGGYWLVQRVFFV